MNLYRLMKDLRYIEIQNNTKNENYMGFRKVILHKQKSVSSIRWRNNLSSNRICGPKNFLIELTIRKTVPKY